MKRLKIVILIVLVPLGLLTIGIGTLHLQAAPAESTIVVDTLVDENDGSCGDGDCSLRDAIEEAHANDTIIFDNGLAGGVIDVSGNGKVIIDKHLTISGTVPITISGNNLVRVFEVAPSSQVTFDSLTISNGNSTVIDCAQGGGFHCGGAIKVLNGAEVTVTNILFSNNTADLGGTIFLFNSQLNVIGSTFISNTGLSGGGIYVNASSTAVVTDSVFMWNSVSDSGGAIDNANGNPLTIYNSLFANNSAKFGGALAGAALTMITVDSSTLRDNTADFGGAIMIGVTDSDLTVLNSTLSGNVAARAGGAIYSQIDGQMLVMNSTITGNSAVGANSMTDGGGAVRMVQAPGFSTFRNSTIVSNTAPNVIDRDGLWLQQGSLSTFNIINAHNGTANCTLDGGTFNGGSFSISDDTSCPGFTVGNPLIKPLADNGGRTLTHALRPGSPAIDGGNNGICPLTDQRGFPRPTDGDGDSSADCDRGAYEAPPWAFSISKSGPTLVAPGQLVTYTLAVTNHLTIPMTNVILTDTLPAGATYVSGGTLIGDVVSWTVPNLAAGTALTRQFMVTTTATITNDDYRVSADGGYSATGSIAVVTQVPVPIEGLQAINSSPTRFGMITTLTATIMAGNFVSYTWDFGDGQMGAGDIVFHMYPDEGVYTATVTAINVVSSVQASTQVTIIPSNFSIYVPVVLKP